MRSPRRCGELSGEIDIAGQAGFASSIQQGEQVRAFYLTGVATDEDDHSGIRLLQCQLQEIVSVTCNHEQAVRGGIGEGFVSCARTGNTSLS